MHTSRTGKMVLVICTAALLASGAGLLSAADDAKNVLVVSVTKGFRHGSIPLLNDIVKDMGDKSGVWQTDYAGTDEELAQKMTAASLRNYDAIVFNNTSGDLPLPDRQALLDWVKAGGGVVGIHAATDSFKIGDDPSKGWAEYIDMMGAQFAGHGPQSEVECIVEDPKHPATKDLPARFKIKEEIYLFTDFSRSKVRGLIWLDKHPNEGTPGDYPVSWCRNYGKGRVFYTSLGHRDDLCKSDLYQRHLSGGIRWALGLEEGDARPVSPPSPASANERRKGFRPVFNGRTLTGWHVRTEGRNPWTVQNGMLVMGHGGTDLITNEKFGDFILRYEYMLPPHGNSGVYLRGRYEVQVTDDYDSKKLSNHGNGAIYDRVTPTQFVSRPVGEWQTGEATIVGNHVTVVLNGVKIIDNVEMKSVTGGALDGEMVPKGPIMLQGDHGPIAYRNIRIKVLKSD